MGPVRTFEEKENPLTQPETEEKLLGLTLRILVSTCILSELSWLPTLRAVKLHEILSCSLR